MTVDQVIARARQTFGSIPLSSATSPNGLDLLNEVYGEMLFDVALLSQEVDVTLTAGTNHYTLTTPMRVFSARYVRSATTGDFRTLEPVSQDEQDERMLQYLRFQNSEPIEFWTLPKSDGTSELWLSPTPPTSTTGGYPKVTVRLTKYTAFSSGSDTLPVGLPSYEAFILGLCVKWASALGDPKLGELEQRFEIKKKQLETYRHSLNARVRPNLRPNYKWRTRKV